MTTKQPLRLRVRRDRPFDLEPQLHGRRLSANSFPWVRARLQTFSQPALTATNTYVGIEATD